MFNMSARRQSEISEQDLDRQRGENSNDPFVSPWSRGQEEIILNMHLEPVPGKRYIIRAVTNDAIKYQSVPSVSSRESKLLRCIFQTHNI